MRRFLFKHQPPPPRKGEINHSFLDRFTLVHFLIGIFYGWWGLPFWGALCLAVLWEIIENPLKYRFTFLFPHHTADTLQNMIGDTLAVIAGWGIFHYWDFVPVIFF